MSSIGGKVDLFFIQLIVLTEDMCESDFLRNQAYSHIYWDYQLPNR